MDERYASIDAEDFQIHVKLAGFFISTVSVSTKDVSQKSCSWPQFLVTIPDLSQTCTHACGLLLLTFRKRRDHCLQRQFDSPWTDTNQNSGPKTGILTEPCCMNHSLSEYVLGVRFFTQIISGCKARRTCTLTPENDSALVHFRHSSGSRLVHTGESLCHKKLQIFDLINSPASRWAVQGFRRFVTEEMSLTCFCRVRERTRMCVPGT